MFASGLVLLALTLAAKPADADHPYGHGRVEILTGLLIGLVLTAGGTLICYDSFERLGQPRLPLAAYVIWPLAVSLLAKTGSGRLQISLWPEAEERRADGRRVERQHGHAFGHGGADRGGADAFGPGAIPRCGPLRRLRGGADRDLRGRPGGRETGLQLMDTMPDESS